MVVTYFWVSLPSTCEKILNLGSSSNVSKVTGNNIKGIFPVHPTSNNFISWAWPPLVAKNTKFLIHDKEKKHFSSCPNNLYTLVLLIIFQKCTLVYDQKRDESRGFGFVTFEDIEDAIEARKDAAGLDVNGHQ